MQIIAGLIADHAEHDPQSGRVHVDGGGVAGIVVPELPATHARLGLLLAIRLERGDGPHDLSIDLHTPSGAHQPIAEVTMEPTPARGGEIRWAAISLLNVQIFSVGPHRIEITGKAIEPFALPIEVRQMSRAAADASLQ